MTHPCLSLHRVAYDPDANAFHAEAQMIGLKGVIRQRVEWRGPRTAGFTRIARGLRDAALRAG